MKNVQVDSMTVKVVVDVERYEAALAKEKRQARGREDREYQRYGKRVADLMVRLGRGNRYRIRKYRRKNAELGWFLQLTDVEGWLRKWHIDPSWVVGFQNTTQLRDGKVRETATIVSCAEAAPWEQRKPGWVREWKVAVPEKWPRQGDPIPKVLE